jgi:hypothetical protein
MIHSGLWKEAGSRWSSAGATRFTVGYFVQYLKYQFCSPSSTLSFQVIFPQPGLLYSLVIFENDVLFRKTNLVICSHHKSCWRPRHACIGDLASRKRYGVYLKVAFQLYSFQWFIHAACLDPTIYGHWRKHFRELVNLDSIWTTFEPIANSVSQETKKQTNLATFVYRNRLARLARQPSISEVSL